MVPPAIFLAVRSLVPALFGWPGAVFPERQKPRGQRIPDVPAASPWPAGTGPIAWLTTREDVMTGLRFGIVSESVLPGRAWLDYAPQIWEAGLRAVPDRGPFS